MEILQVRNATQIITYGGRRFLVDPIISEKSALPPFPSLRGDERNPLHDLPLAVPELTAVDAVIVTHLHADHFDEAAKRELPKNLPMFVQNAADRDVLIEAGFLDARVLGADTAFEGVQLIRTPGQHGYDEAVVRALGDVCGVVMRSAAEETLYITGDTVWFSGVAETIAHYLPQVIIVNAGANSAADKQLIAGRDEVLRIHEAAPEADIVATHMEAINHWVLSKKELRAFAEKNGFSAKVFIPDDGETLRFGANPV